MLKKFIGRSTADHVRKIKDSLGECHFAAKEVISHGFPHHPTALACDMLQSLVAIGNETGTIKIFGKDGVEVCLQHEPKTSIKQLIFITNKGFLISVTDNCIISLWTLKQQPAEMIHQMRLNKERITKCSYAYGSDWLYVGTGSGNVYITNVESLELSGYTIYWNKVVEREGIQKHKPGDVVDILEHPMDQKKVLLGFTSGLMVIWNLVDEKVEHRYYYSEVLESLCWMSSGKEFAALFSNGVVRIWSVNATNRPKEMFPPYVTTRETARGNNDYSISSVKKLQCINFKGNSLFVFPGTSPVGCETPKPHVTLMQGRSHSKLLCDSVIIDFTMSSSPYSIDDPKKPKLLILCEKGLVVFDISEVGNPQHYNVPHMLDLHKPAVTSMEYVNECPENLLSSLNLVKPKQSARANQHKPWPFSGGNWENSDEEFPSSGLIITGYSDGSVKFWNAESALLLPTITINTQNLFERTSLLNSQQNHTEESHFPVSHVILNSVDWSLIVVSDRLCVMLYAFQPSKPTTAVKNLTIQLTLSHPPEGVYRHKYVTDSLASECAWSLLPEASSAGEGAGFYLQLCCQCVPQTPGTRGVNDIALITCVEYSSTSGILVIGLNCGLVIVDTVESKFLLVEVNELDFIANALDSKTGWGFRKSAASFTKATKKGEVSSIHQKAAMLVTDEAESISLKSAKTNMFDQARMMNSSAQTMGASFSEDQLHVNTVSLVDLNVIKHYHIPTLCVWVGTNKGNVIMMTIRVELSCSKQHPRTVKLIHSGIVHKLYHPTVSMTFLSGSGDIISSPSQQHTLACDAKPSKEEVTYADDSRETHADNPRRTHADDPRVTQYAVLCSEVLCKVYTFPDHSKLTKAELVDKTRTTIVKTKTCHITGCPSLISLTLNGKILVHSLPSLRPITAIPYEPLCDLRAFRTFQIATNGSSAVFMSSPSELQRLSLLESMKVDSAKVQPKLFMKVADPEIPSGRGFLSSLFSRSRHSTVGVNREELFGVNAGRPLRSKSQMIKGTTGMAADTTDSLPRLKRTQSERGRRSRDVEENTTGIRNRFSSQRRSAHDIRKKYAIPKR